MSFPLVSLGDFVKIARNGIGPEKIQSGTNYVGLENIDGSGNFVDVKGVDAGELASSKFLFTQKQVLFGKLRPYLKKIARPDFDGICSTDILPLLPSKEIDRDYLFHTLRRQSFVDDVSSLSSGANLPRISPKVLSEMQIPLPPLKEQRRIAAILDKADALRAQRCAAIAKLDELLQSVFVDMFGDPITNPKAKVVELSELCGRITDGTHQSPQWAESGVPFLFQSNVKPFEIDFSTKKSISVEEYKSLTARCPIEYGDVLFTIVGSYGNAAMVKTQEKFCFQRHIAHLKPHKDVLPQFLEAMLNQKAIKQQADERVTGIAQKTLILKELRALKVLHPPLIEQQKFSVIATRIQTIKSEMRRSAEKLDELLLSLQQRAFSGKL